MVLLRSLFALFVLLSTVSAQASSDQAYWSPFLGARQPAAEELPRLLTELNTLLASPDPQLRDDVAYTLFAKWIGRDRILPVAERKQLLATWLGNLQIETGAAADGALRRSFSALCLGLLVMEDNLEPWLTPPDFERIMLGALAYLRSETDVRGLDPKVGWVHTVAHTADLLKFLARSPHLKAADQAAMLTAIVEKLANTDAALVFGEDERLARAVLSLAARTDLDQAAFRHFVATLWPRLPAGPPTVVDLAHDHNRRHLLQSLHALLLVDPRDLPSLGEAREIVLVQMKKRLR